jgi:hypothetical protein
MIETKTGCPFCGCHSTHVLGPENSTHGNGYQVECINCATRGPCGMKSPKDAVLVWDYGDCGYQRVDGLTNPGKVG